VFGPIFLNSTVFKLAFNADMQTNYVAYSFKFLFLFLNLNITNIVNEILQKEKNRLNHKNSMCLPKIELRIVWKHVFLETKKT
jgi:hypothetical protein